jgi:hypothetical protein
MPARLTLLAFLVLATAGCGPVAPAAPPIEIQPSQAESLLQFSSDLNRQRVVMEGYVYFDNGRAGEAIAMGPELRSAQDGAGEPLVRFEIEYGEAANQLNLKAQKRELLPGVPNAPETLVFDPTKATWQDAAGKAHPLSRKLRLTGRLEYIGINNVGLLSDEDSRSPTGRRFKPRLVDVDLAEALH